ncbi:MAG: hypothetical protein ACI8RY_000529 [Urechidicola sp.]|jgi:hypothetical protein
MKKLVILIAYIFILGNSFTQESKEKAEATFVININGKEYTINEGEELKIDTSTIFVKMAEYRKIKTEYLSFNYPSNFSFEFDKEFGFKNWTLSGNDFVIMYFEIEIKSELDEFVNAMVTQFGEKNCKTKKTKKKLGNLTLKGTNILVSVFGEQLSIDFLEINPKGNKSKFIAFQDSLDQKKSSKEGIKTLNMISKSIIYR